MGNQDEERMVPLWMRSASEKSFVRGSRPQSAKSVSSNSRQPYKRVVAGSGVHAVRAKAKSNTIDSSPVKTKRPSTAPIGGREKPRKDSIDDWYGSLKRHGLLKTGQKKNKVSLKYLQEAAQKRRQEEERLIQQTYKEQEQYERGCIARMAEATRWAQALGLGKKFNPIFSKRASSSSPGIGSPDEKKDRPNNLLERGELRCEVAAKDDSKTRVISCELFEREHAKLLHRHRKMLLEEEGRAASTAAQALKDAGVLLESTTVDPCTFKKKRTVRKIMSSSESGKSSSSLPQGSYRSFDLGGETVVGFQNDIEVELRSVLEETESLTKILTAQVNLLKQNGWNMGS